MNYLKWPLALFLLLLNLSVYSQEEHHAETQEPERLRDLFTEAHLHGHLRNYFMNTVNRGDLKNYYTNATGGAVGFTTGNYKGFEAGVKGIFTYKTFGSDLGMEDPIAGKNARYEYELYDVLNKGNFKDLDRLEELFIRYRFGNSYLTYGKIETEYTPLLNHSDGRMKPFAHRGAWAHLNFGKPHQFNLGWLNGMSPRATTEWFDFEEGIGLFYNGFQPDGQEAHYHEHYTSSGMGIFNYRYRRNNFTFKVYDYYLDKVMNTLWTQVDYEFKDFNLGVQYVYQSPFSYNEDLAYENRYVQPGENGQVLSSQLSWQESRLRLAMAYTHAFDSGRFLFPKELGRDHFFTSISRSRLEGMGDVDIVALKGEYSFLKPNLHLGVEMQQIKGAEPGDYRYNKYNVDESFQLNTHLRYNVEGFLDGLSFDLLWVYRENQNHNDAESIFNKSNFNQINFVTNFYF
ncbi:MAG: hypothetical protein RI572_09875 [Salegentibacter sp.]|uniref:hypothetical protein n=1 Tax=Salegentibacter sp. TaxID=1903072 RepID=UPI0028703A54|nr:hypothetical protein [Salegentibacter sp.]MDR9457707.1 hypothetical protein [Salegentibacter sp.]